MSAKEEAEGQDGLPQAAGHCPDFPQQISCWSATAVPGLGLSKSRGKQPRLADGFFREKDQSGEISCSLESRISWQNSSSRSDPDLCV